MIFNYRCVIVSADSLVWHTGLHLHSGCGCSYIPLMSCCPEPKLALSSSSLLSALLFSIGSMCRTGMSC